MSRTNDASSKHNAQISEHLDQLKADAQDGALKAAEQVKDGFNEAGSSFQNELHMDIEDAHADMQRTKERVHNAVDTLTHPDKLKDAAYRKAEKEVSHVEDAIVELEHPRQKIEQVKQSMHEHSEAVHQATAEFQAQFSSPMDKKRLPIILRVFGILCIVGGAAAVAFMVKTIISAVELFRTGAYAGDGTSTTVVTFLHMGVLLALAITSIFFGIRLIRNRRRWAAITSYVLYILIIAGALCSIMLAGVNVDLWFYLGVFILTVALQSYLDPSLLEERRLHRKQHDEEVHARAQEGTLGLDLSGKGYITLNFFNLFWMFVVASILGLFMEEIFHFLVVAPGQWQDRAGLLFGPFSPIYGIGAVLMTVFLNRLHNRSVILIFFISAIIGGAFEYATSVFMQYAYGAVAWNYTGMWLSIGGRTCGLFMGIWGLLGVLWIKLGLPFMLRVVNLIPWNWRYVLTVIAAVLMLVDAGMTLQSLDCWYERLSGSNPDTPIQQFYDQHFDNTFMADRFQSMTIHPSDAVRHK